MIDFIKRPADGALPFINAGSHRASPYLMSMLARVGRLYLTTELQVHPKHITGSNLFDGEPIPWFLKFTPTDDMPLDKGFLALDGNRIIGIINLYVDPSLVDSPETSNAS